MYKVLTTNKIQKTPKTVFSVAPNERIICFKRAKREGEGVSLFTKVGVKVRENEKGMTEKERSD